MRSLFTLFSFCIGVGCLSPAFAGGDVTFALLTGQVWKEEAKECTFLKWEKYSWAIPQEKLRFPNIKLTFGKLEAGPLQMNLTGSGNPEEKKPQAMFISLYEKDDKAPMALEEFKVYYESVRQDMDATLGEKGKVIADKNTLYWKSLGSDVALVLGLNRTDKGLEPEFLRIVASPLGQIDQALKQVIQL